VHFHDKPPVAGRELVAEDVCYSIERFLTVKGGARRWTLQEIDQVKVLDTYTVQVDLKQSNVWLLDYMANATTLPIIAKEVVAQFGDLKQPEAVIGTGPWMLASYDRKVQAVFTKNPHYFRQGLPYLDTIHFMVIDDDSTASAAYMTGQLDFGYLGASTIGLEEMPEFKQRHPDWHYEPFLYNVTGLLIMRTDTAPFHDQRVRQAISMAINRAEIMALSLGQGALDTAVPAALRDWYLPVEQLHDGARYYQYQPEAARRLLKEAGYPQGFTAPMLVYTGYSSRWADIIDLVSNYLRQVGINVHLDNKEYGAYLHALRKRQYEGMGLTLRRPSLIPDAYVYVRYRPDNVGKVDDPTMWQLIQKQHQEKDVRQRKAILDALSRQAAVNQYYIHFPASVRVASWASYVRNFNTNLGYDYGGRMEAAWFAKS
jgi:peptide/nickel transport system substrate-binding protein